MYSQCESLYILCAWSEQAICIGSFFSDNRQGFSTALRVCLTWPHICLILSDGDEIFEQICIEAAPILYDLLSCPPSKPVNSGSVCEAKFREWWICIPICVYNPFSQTFSIAKTFRLSKEEQVIGWVCAPSHNPGKIKILKPYNNVIMCTIWWYM